MPVAKQRTMPGLSHPVFWTALLVLLINDHLLKHAGLLPGPVTGKLSDFAGMVVAPVLLAAMLRVRRKGRLLVLGLVAGGFSALKLSRLCADSVEAVMSPLRWQVWCDPTDLVALSMLPVAWWLGSLADAETRPVRNDWRACVREAGWFAAPLLPSPVQARGPRPVGYCASTLPHSAWQRENASPAQSQPSHIEQAMSPQDATAFRHLVTHRLSLCLQRPSKTAPLSAGHSAATLSLAAAQVPSACGAQPRNRPPPHEQTADMHWVGQ